MSRLLRASETRRGGVTLKSLTLAPHVVHKRPTHAVTCETLRHLALLQRVLAAAGLPDALGGRLVPAVAYVLTYELLLGQVWCSACGPAACTPRCHCCHPARPTSPYSPLHRPSSSPITAHFTPTSC